MSTFSEYAALARQLADQRRETDQDAAADAARRRALHASADQLGQRLAVQSHRLGQLGRALGLPTTAAPGTAAPTAPAPATPAPSTAASSAATPAPSTAAPSTAASAPSSMSVPSSASASSSVSAPSSVPVAGPPTGFAPAPGPGSQAGFGAGRPGSPPAGGGPGTATGAGTVVDGGAAAAPGRPGVGAYPTGTASGALVALPAAAGVPAPRAGGVDPAAELAEARRLADEADRLVQVTEAVARHPPLLPTWSPLSRAVAVYAGSAAAGILLALVMLNAGGLVLGAGALYAASCAGLPVLSFVAGYLVLGRWGRPVLGAEGPPPRFVPLGFVICVLLVPLAQCGYLLLARLAP